MPKVSVVLDEVNRPGVDAEWEFNEWCHGATGRPMGYPHQAWSAGMYVLAHRCVQVGRMPIFDETWNAKPRSEYEQDKSGILRKKVIPA